MKLYVQNVKKLFLQITTFIIAIYVKQIIVINVLMNNYRKKEKKNISIKSIIYYFLKLEIKNIF